MTHKPKKCHVGFHNIEALGHRISRVGIHTSPDKVAAIRDMAAPTNVRLIRTFLGLAGYYRRFIKDYATIARPLSELTKKDHPFAWGDRQQRAFEALKQRLCEEPILAAPDFSLPFVIYTDASSFGLGAVLAQIQDGEERVIAYLSRQTKDAETRYTPTELECLAVVWALDNLSVYVHGHKFTLHTDHSALRQLFTLTHQQVSRQMVPPAPRLPRLDDHRTPRRYVYRPRRRPLAAVRHMTSLHPPHRADRVCLTCHLLGTAIATQFVTHQRSSSRICLPSVHPHFQRRSDRSQSIRRTTHPKDQVRLRRRFYSFKVHHLPHRRRPQGFALRPAFQFRE